MTKMIQVKYARALCHDGYYCGKVVRNIVPLSSGQFYVMELQDMECSYCEDGHGHIEWNVYQCVVDKTDDKTIYDVDCHTITGRAPMETYHAAMSSLKAILSFLENEYEVEWKDCDTCCHCISADWADERRKKVYSKVLGKMKDWEYDSDSDCFQTVVVENCKHEAA